MLKQKMQWFKPSKHIIILRENNQINNDWKKIRKRVKKVNIQKHKRFKGQSQKNIQNKHNKNNEINNDWKKDQKES